MEHRLARPRHVLARWAYGCIGYSQDRFDTFARKHKLTSPSQLVVKVRLGTEMVVLCVTWAIWGPKFSSRSPL